MSEQDGTGLEQGGPASASPSGRTIAKAEYHHYGGILPFAILHRVWYTQLNKSEFKEVLLCARRRNPTELGWIPLLL